MLHELRRRFIIIAMLSVTLVLLVMTVAISTMTFYFLNQSLKETLLFIAENNYSVNYNREHDQQETMQWPDVWGWNARNPVHNPERPFSYRYFTLKYSTDTSFYSCNLAHVASVDVKDVASYLEYARECEPGFGNMGHYKYYISTEDQVHYMAVFLDYQVEKSDTMHVLFISLFVDVIVLAVVHILILKFSQKAVDPALRGLERQKRFITDVSHELKTPLTIISTSLTLLEMENGKQKWTGKIRTQTERMREMVNQLVELSRLDEENPPIRKTVFDLTTAVRETAESFSDFAQADGRKIECTLTEGCSYNGDESGIREMVSILLDNAVKYSAPGGTIELKLKKARRGLVLTCSNPCLDLEQIDPESLFDRFYRTDSSRSKDTGGFGIGLSIARGIIEAHGGTIHASKTPTPGIEFTVVF